MGRSFLQLEKKDINKIEKKITLILLISEKFN